MAFLPDRSLECSSPSNRSAVFDHYQRNRRNQEKMCQKPCELHTIVTEPVDVVEEALEDPKAKPRGTKDLHQDNNK